MTQRHCGDVTGAESPARHAAAASPVPALDGPRCAREGRVVGGGWGGGDQSCVDGAVTADTAGDGTERDAAGDGTERDAAGEGSTTIGV